MPAAMDRVEVDVWRPDVLASPTVGTGGGGIDGEQEARSAADRAVANSGAVAVMVGLRNMMGVVHTLSALAIGRPSWRRGGATVAGLTFAGRVRWDAWGL